MNTPDTQRGLSIIELLVGIAVGLVVVAGATHLIGTSVIESRRQLGEDRLMQDLRAATDVVGRNLRRAGHWGHAASAVGAGGAVVNPYAAAAPAAAASDAVAFEYSRDVAENDAVDSDERFGFRLRRGVLEMQVGSAGWQALTDANVVEITRFEILPQVRELALPCPDACRAGSTQCPPRQRIAAASLTLGARGVADRRVQRTLQSDVRLRNDAVIGRCDA